MASAGEVSEDEQRWAQALALLDRLPTEAGEQRLRRWRRRRIWTLLALLLASVAVIVIVTVLLGGVSSPVSAVPRWQQIAGFSVASAGLVLQLTGVVAAVRSTRRVRAWNSPLAVLTAGQRKELAAAVRGRRSIAPDRLPLARLLAEQLLVSRTSVVANAGLEVLFIGQWIADPATWRAVIAVGYGVLLAIVWPFLRRDIRAAQRFLLAHPTPAR
ncbi:hypothetical protein [Geodermatophilus sp. SYSU D00710]